MSSVARAGETVDRSLGRWWILLVLPVVGLALLLASPSLDTQLEHHPTHFWLVLSTAVVGVILAYLTNVVATRQRDPRLTLISLAFLAAAGFLGLHALATPGVLLPAPNTGFATATPVGLFIASLFAAASVTPLAGPRGAVVLRAHSALLAVLVGSMLVWGFVSLASLPPLSGPPPSTEAFGLIGTGAAAAVALYLIAAYRTFGVYRARGGVVTFAIAIALVLLGEAMLVVAVSRNWHLSWWEWHVLMALAFASIALGARQEYRRSGSLSATFGGLYSDATLARIDRWHARAIADVARADERGESTDAVIDQLRDEGASADEVALVASAAVELRRLDTLFRPYLPSVVADQLRTDGASASALGAPELAGLGVVEREVSVLFADLAGFTRFSEQREPGEVIEMLNTFWAEIVPAIHDAGGDVGGFEGDGVMATFNTAGDQPDHAVRAARAGLTIVEVGGRIASTHSGWPTFRVGVNTGPAVVGNVGSEDRRELAVIGNTTNVAARLLTVAEPGQVVIAGSTRFALGAAAGASPLGPTTVKGKSEPVDAWILRSLSSSAPMMPPDGQRDRRA